MPARRKLLLFLESFTHTQTQKQTVSESEAPTNSYHCANAYSVNFPTSIHIGCRTTSLARHLRFFFQPELRSVFSFASPHRDGVVAIFLCHIDASTVWRAAKGVGRLFRMWSCASLAPDERKRGGVKTARTQMEKMEKIWCSIRANAVHKKSGVKKVLKTFGACVWDADTKDLNDMEFRWTWNGRVLFRNLWEKQMPIGCIERGASNLQSTGLVEQVIRERNWSEMDIIGPKNDMNCWTWSASKASGTD